jgi:hypothetical protein
MVVPPSLRIWFLVHAAVFAAVGLPLLVAPVPALHAIGWDTSAPNLARAIGVLLLGCAWRSFEMRAAGVEAVRTTLRFWIVMSFGGALAMLLAIGSGFPSATWAFLSAFIAFAGVWVHHAIRFRQLDQLGRLDDSDSDGDPQPDSTV